MSLKKRWCLKRAVTLLKDVYCRGVGQASEEKFFESVMRALLSSSADMLLEAPRHAKLITALLRATVANT